MEKYKNIGTITDEFLHGSLIELELKYNTDDNIHLQILYRFNDFMKLSYEISLDLVKEKAIFLSHGSNGAFDKVRLDREPKFDSALENVFFAH